MLVDDRKDNTRAEVSPLLSSKELTKRAKPKRTEMLGWETNCANSPEEQRDRQTNQSRHRLTTHGREKTNSSETACHLDRAASLKPIQKINPRDVRQLVQGKLAHITLQRNPIKDESLPNMILFSFVTVVLLEMLVPKINWVVFKLN